jgi:predicted transposase/invertase (TIGR01784 family)
MHSLAGVRCYPSRLYLWQNQIKNEALSKGVNKKQKFKNKLYLCAPRTNLTMIEHYTVFIDPFTDYGIKRLFTLERNKLRTISFLNTLDLDEHHILGLTFTPTEHGGGTKDDRTAVFDFSCLTDDGRRIIVEMQNAFQRFFGDRSVFYFTFPVQKQAPKGADWNYQLDPVYFVAILNFKMSGDYVSNGDYLHKIQLKDQNNRVFSKKFKLIFLEMPNFTKQLIELESDLDEWLYVLNNMTKFKEIPSGINKPHLIELLEDARLANFSKQELMDYETSLKEKRDKFSQIDSAVHQVSAEKQTQIEEERNLKLQAQAREQAERNLKLQAQAREETERAQKETERAQKETERAQKETERAQKEVLIRKSVLALHAKGVPAEEIASILDLELSLVLQIIAEAK